MAKQYIRACILYDDDKYDPALACGTAGILTNHGFGAPGLIDAGKLTKNKAIPAEDWQPLFARAYGEPGVLGVHLIGARRVEDEPDWMFRIEMTFRKNPKGAKSTYQPWNVMTLMVDAERLRDPAAFARFLDCTKALIVLTNPISADVDEMGRAIRLTSRSRDKHAIRERANQVYWGNYWSPAWLSQLPEGTLAAVPSDRLSTIGEGVFFTMSRDIFTRQQLLPRWRLLRAIHESERKR